MKSFFKGLSPQSAAILVVLAALGVVFTTLGIVLDVRVPFASRLFISLGGSALGGALSISFVRIFEPSQLGSLVKILAGSSVVSTEERHFSQFRKRLHGYLRSHNEDGTCVWRYRVFDFSTSSIPGHLHTLVTVPRPNGKARGFIYDGYICGDHLLLIGQPVETGSEQHVVHVFPDALKTMQSGLISGICFVDSYDKTKLLTPTILAEDALTTQTECGPVSDQDAATLARRWNSQMGNIRELNFDPAVFRAVNL
jgi:hypothetical protein